MKKKNFLWSLLAMMMVAVLSAGFIACSDDDDDDDDNGVVGTWSGRDEDGDHYLTLTFKKDGTGTWTSNFYNSYSGRETERGSFSYEMEGKSKGVITIIFYDSHYNHMHFEIEGKKMYLFDGHYGEEWILTKE